VKGSLRSNVSEGTHSSAVSRSTSHSGSSSEQGSSKYQSSQPATTSEAASSGSDGTGSRSPDYSRSSDLSSTPGNTDYSSPLSSAATTETMGSMHRSSRRRRMDETDIRSQNRAEAHIMTQEERAKASQKQRDAMKFVRHGAKWRSRATSSFRRFRSRGSEYRKNPERGRNWRKCRSFYLIIFTFSNN
jgi:hypothetical protein